ncbi:alpha/beta hydrolase [Pseudoalteromonas maricaloris]|nr:alpha/beta hydrolase-fold protein [Pseudoalteromonas maricaloris]
MEEERPYMVYLPPSYNTNSKSYPVIYLLDGDVHRFKGFVGVLESLSTETLGNQVQEAIVIAIPNTNRSRDLTPSRLNEWTFKGRVLDSFSQTGNASQFQDFLEKELIPQIDQTYRATSKRLLVGESFGGLFAANALLSSSSLFTDYLIIDPTALWDNDYLNRTYSNNKPQKYGFNVYFAFANNSHLGEIGLTNYKWGTSFASSVINNIQKKIGKQQYFENETHGTVAFLAWYEGLKILIPTTE